MAVNFYAAIPLMAVLAVLQTAVLPRFPIAGLEPQLVFLVALAWGLLRGLEEGLVWAFIAGLWIDLFSMTPLGLSSLALVAMAFLASLSEGRVWRSHIILPLAVALIASVGYHAISAAVLFLSGNAVDWLTVARQVLLPSALLNAALILPIYAFVRWLHGLVYPEAVA